MDPKKMNLDDIIEWCKANNEIAWLKETAAKTYPVKDDEGNVYDERQITFIELKFAFINKFMPELAPKKKEKKLTMYEIIDTL